MSPYAADHNLLPHLQNIQLHAQVLPPLKKKKKKSSRPPVRDRETITTSNEKCTAHFADERVESFPGSAKCYWLKAPFT